MSKRTIKYVVVHVVVEHDDDVDAVEVCERAELISDIDGGQIAESKVVDVMDPADVEQG